MIQLEFRLDGITPAAIDPAFLLGLSAELLETTGFLYHVRFRAGGVELFEMASQEQAVFICQVEQEIFERDETSTGSGPWISIPILHLATVGLERVRKACAGSPAIYHLPGGGSLQFQPFRDEVEISSSFSRRSARNERDELLGAFIAFSDRVRQFLVSEFPWLVRHPGWPGWFPEQRA